MRTTLRYLLRVLPARTQSSTYNVPGLAVNMTASEEAVLAPLDSSIEDDDDWPEFRLKDVTVFEPDGLTLTSLLAASTISGLHVRGVLDGIDDDKERLGKSVLRLPGESGF